MIIIAIIACLIHHIIRALRWFRASQVWAIGVFGVLLKRGPVKFEVFGGEKMFYKDGAKGIESELRWHSGSVRRLFPKLHYHIQEFSPIVALVCIWFSGATKIMLFLPVAFWLISYTYFHFFGWKWLRSACVSHQQKVLIGREN